MNARAAKMSYDQSQNTVLREAGYYHFYDTRSEAGRAAFKRLCDKQDDSFKKLLIWEKNSKRDIAAAKNRRQLVWAYLRAPRYMQNYEIIGKKN